MKKEIIKIKYAIMFTDMLNSTERYEVQGDETAYKHVSKHFELLKPIVSDYNGYLVKTAGDSIMATYKNPNDGVQAAIIMQQTLYDYNKGKDLDGTIEIRIGLHYGEVIEENGEIVDFFGDQVNTAARIESMADRYTIFISKQLKEIIDTKHFSTIYIGDYYVKGKLEPLVIYGILWSDNVNWLKNIYHKTRKNLVIKQNKNRIIKERRDGKVGQTGALGVLAPIKIVTKPEGAKVWLDNELFHLKTPFCTDYKVGELILKIEMQGFRTITDQIEIFEDTPNELFNILEDLRGTILIETGKSEFSIRINNILKQGITTPYKFNNMLPGKYLINVISDKQFSYPEEIELKEKQHLVFKPQIFFYSNIAIISQYKKNILIIETLNKLNSTNTKKIKYETHNKFIKEISQELKLEPGRYLIKSETYPFLKAEIEIDSVKLSIIDFDELIPKVEFKAICGKYNSNIKIQYENRIDNEKIEQSGEICRQIFPDKTFITIKYKSIHKKLKHNFSKSSLEYNFEEIIKTTIRKNIYRKVAKILPLIILSFYIIYYGPNIYKKNISPKILRVKKNTEVFKEKLGRGVKVSNLHKKIQTSNFQILCSAKNTTIIISKKNFTKTIRANENNVIPIGKYTLAIKSKNYKTQNHEIIIEAEKDFRKEYILEPSSETPQNLVFVRGGIFKMRSNSSEEHTKFSKVKIDDFYIGKFEVTQEEWKQTLKTNPAYFKDNSHPIENIDWFEAINYCNKRSEIEGLTLCYTINNSKVYCDFNANGYRLPTEAEWEFAARGGTKTQNFIYSGSNSINEVAWFQGNSSNKSHPVGTKLANELGIFDMSGNVWEWCWDLYGKYPKKMQRNPKGSDIGNRRTKRQGSWNRSESYSRVGYRETASPNIKSNSIGFRYVRTTLLDK